jgi:hypothetical protein
MDFADDSGLGQAQQVVVALQVFGVVLEAFAAERGLIQPVRLDHGAHGTVDYQDTLGKKATELVRAVKTWRRGRRGKWGQFQAVRNLIEWCYLAFKTRASRAHNSKNPHPPRQAPSLAAVASERLS